MPERFGRYVLFHRLEQSADSSIHLARAGGEPKILEPVALERWAIASPERARWLSWLQASSERLAACPHLARVLDAGQVGEEQFLATEHVHDWPLEDLPWPAHSIDSAVRIAVGVLSALETLHAALADPAPGSIRAHGAISMKSVRVGEDGVVRLHGLGAIGIRPASIASARESIDTASPEAAVGGAIDARSDVYSAGVILYEILTGRPYLRRATLEETRMQAIDPVFAPPSSLRPDLPSRIDAVLRAALEVEPRDRLSSAADMKQALCAIVPAAERPLLASALAELVGEERWRERFEASTHATMGELQAFWSPGESLESWEVPAAAPRRSDAPTDPGPHTSTNAIGKTATHILPTRIAPTFVRSDASVPVVAAAPQRAAKRPPLLVASAVAASAIAALLVAGLALGTGRSTQVDPPPAEPVAAPASVQPPIATPVAAPNAPAPADEQQEHARHGQQEHAPPGQPQRAPPELRLDPEPEGRTAPGSKAAARSTSETLHARREARRRTSRAGAAITETRVGQPATDRAAAKADASPRRVQKLIDRARVLKGRSGDSTAAADVGRVLNGLMQEASVPQEDAAHHRRLDDFEREIEALEKR